MNDLRQIVLPSLDVRYSGGFNNLVYRQRELYMDSCDEGIKVFGPKGIVEQYDLSQTIIHDNERMF